MNQLNFKDEIEKKYIKSKNDKKITLIKSG
jgi:hypothetical protein